MPSLHLSGCAREEPPGSSLAAELMSMSADDWAACLFAADAGRLSCPLIDCFAVSSSSGALPQSDLLSKARQREGSHAGIFPLANAVWLTSCPPFLLPAGLYMALFPLSFAWMVAPSNTISASDGKSRKEGMMFQFHPPIYHLAAQHCYPFSLLIPLLTYITVHTLPTNHNLLYINSIVAHNQVQKHAKEGHSSLLLTSMYKF